MKGCPFYKHHYASSFIEKHIFTCILERVYTLHVYFTILHKFKYGCIRYYSLLLVVGKWNGKKQSWGQSYFLPRNWNNYILTLCKWLLRKYTYSHLITKSNYQMVSVIRKHLIMNLKASYQKYYICYIQHIYYICYIQHIEDVSPALHV